MGADELEAVFVRAVGTLHSMHLPNCEDAVIAKEKLTDYLLSETHPIGRTKAAFFRSHGFDDGQVQILGERLVAIAQSSEVVQTEVTRFGVKYIVDGTLSAPNGRDLKLRTVWIIELDDGVPRFITAYPI